MAPVLGTPYLRTVWGVISASSFAFVRFSLAARCAKNASYIQATYR